MRRPSLGNALQWLGGLVVRWPLAVIAFWIALTACLSVVFPPLTQVVRERPMELLPADSPSMVASREMSEAFHDSGLQNILLIVLTNKDGEALQPADEDVYRAIADKLKRDSDSVVLVQDFVSNPPLREVMASKDQKAWYLAAGIAGALGSPQAYDGYKRVAGEVATLVAGSSLTAHLTGPAATVADAADAGEHDLRLVETATVVMVLTILLVVYRNPVTMMLPLLAIAVSLFAAQGVVSGLTRIGLGVSGQTLAFMTALVVGAGTDYAVFLISRYHEYLRLGLGSDEAVVRALVSIGEVITASAGTVALTFLGMLFTTLGLFATIGPPLAVSVAVAFMAAMTFLPAILVLAGRRGWVVPRRDLTTRFWRRSGIHIVRRPKIHLVASLGVLIALASCSLLVRYNYDERKSLPESTGSNQGYAAMEKHFPVNGSLPQYLIVQSPHDLRTPKALADLEQMAQRLSQVGGIDVIRGITRPTGESLEQARVSFQAGEVGSKLGDASGLIKDRSGDLDLLTTGANTLADALGDVRTKITQSVSYVGTLVDSLSYLQNQFGGSKTLDQFDHAAELVKAMQSLGDTIGLNLANITNGFDWAGPVLTALDASPICDADPSCSDTRGQLQRLVAARDDGTLNKIADLARQLQNTQGSQTLESTASGLRNALDVASKAMRSLRLETPGSVQSQLATLQQGADTLADGSRKLAQGVQLLVDQTRQLGAGLSDASSVLLAMKSGASTPSMAGFYVPPQLLTRDEFKKAAQIFISPDGHTVRYLVQTKLNVFSSAAMDQVNALIDTARAAQPNTEIADAKISMTGFAVTLRDIRDYYDRDLKLIMIITISIVLLILIALLRAVVAPLYLIGSVIISYMSALGIGVVFFQFILHQDLHWSVPGLAFIVLVAVGADYNMLLISRLREESPEGIRSGVIRTVGSTGGVITSAGVIFAASMLGLTFGSVTTMTQAGLIMGVGLLIDTFLVRTVLVPAMATLVGRANWWPSRWAPGAEPAGSRPVPTRTPLKREDQLTLF